MSGTDEFHHGISHRRVGDGPGAVEIYDTNTVGANLCAPEADASIPQNEPFLLFKSDTDKRALIGNSGNAKKYIDQFFMLGGSMLVVNLYEDNTDADTKLQNAIGDQNSNSGVFALEAAESHLHVKPRFLVTPDLSNKRVSGAANPVVIAQKLVAENIGAIQISGAPNTSDEDAVTFRQDFNDPRLVIFDPHVKGLDAEEYSPELLIAAIANKTDRDIGFHASWGNKICDIAGVSRAVPMSISNSNTRANYLLSNQVNTIVSYGGGWRTWGDYAATSDTDRQFYCQTRTEDFIQDGLARVFVDIISDPLIEDQVSAGLERGQQFLDALQRDKKIYGGRMSFKGNRNSTNALELGKLVVSYAAYSPPPITRVDLEYTKDERYLELEVSKLIARSSFRQAA